MAARLRRAHLDLSREKIQTTQLIKRLQANALGELELTAVQQRSIEILLRKTLPDLSAVEHTGEVTSYVLRAPAPAATVDEWQEQHGPRPPTIQ